MIKHWQSAAPGSLMLFGEHSVLQGYPAIACAVDRWLTVDWVRRDDDRIVIVSQLAQHETDWQSLMPHPQLTFVMASLLWLKEHSASPCAGLTLTIRSDIDSTQGLGSSSAVVAAMLLGFEPLLGFQTQQQRFNAGLSIIRAVQGRGSGTDLAAAITGGVMMLYPVKEQITRIADTLPIVSVYCGYKTPTPTVIAHVQQAWQAAPVLLQQQYAWMGEITQQAVVAIQQQDLQLLGRYMNIAHGLLHGLGVSDAALDAIVHRLRATQGIIGAKISGSGLGDCVIGLGTTDIAIDDALILEITPKSAHVQELR